MKAASQPLRSRAFQEVPRDMRRRTASHNVKQVPKRLRARAAKEMVLDNTPVKRKKRILPQQRMRIETIRRMQAIRKRMQDAKKAKKVKSHAVAKDSEVTMQKDGGEEDKKAGDLSVTPIRIRKPRAKAGILKTPPVPPARFRKRQKDKSWLPTHLFHAKRAHMTPPKEPLWGFAVPLKPTEKSYRKTHRATTSRGAIAWDTSYMSAIELRGA